MMSGIKYVISQALSSLCFLPCSFASFFDEPPSFSDQKVSESVPISIAEDSNNFNPDPLPLAATRFASAPTYYGSTKYPMPKILGWSEHKFLGNIYSFTTVDIEEELSKLPPMPYTNYRLPKVQVGDYEISVHLDSNYLNLKRPIISFVSVYGFRGAELVKYQSDLYSYHKHVYTFQPPDLSPFLSED